MKLKFFSFLCFIFLSLSAVQAKGPFVVHPDLLHQAHYETNVDEAHLSGDVKTFLIDLHEAEAIEVRDLSLQELILLETLLMRVEESPAAREVRVVRTRPLEFFKKQDGTVMGERGQYVPNIRHEEKPFLTDVYRRANFFYKTYGIISAEMKTVVRLVAQRSYNEAAFVPSMDKAGFDPALKAEVLALLDQYKERFLLIKERNENFGQQQAIEESLRTIIVPHIVVSAEERQRYLKVLEERSKNAKVPFHVLEAHGTWVDETIESRFEDVLYAFSEGVLHLRPLKEILENKVLAAIGDKSDLIRYYNQLLPLRSRFAEIVVRLEELPHMVAGAYLQPEGSDNVERNLFPNAENDLNTFLFAVEDTLRDGKDLSENPDIRNFVSNLPSVALKNQFEHLVIIFDNYLLAFDNDPEQIVLDTIGREVYGKNFLIDPEFYIGDQIRPKLGFVKEALAQKDGRTVQEIVEKEFKHSFSDEAVKDLEAWAESLGKPSDVGAKLNLYEEARNNALQALYTSRLKEAKQKLGFGHKEHMGSLRYLLTLFPHLTGVHFEGIDFHGQMMFAVNPVRAKLSKLEFAGCKLNQRDIDQLLSTEWPNLEEVLVDFVSEAHAPETVQNLQKVMPQLKVFNGIDIDDAENRVVTSPSPTKGSPVKPKPLGYANRYGSEGSVSPSKGSPVKRDLEGRRTASSSPAKKTMGAGDVARELFPIPMDHSGLSRSLSESVL